MTGRLGTQPQRNAKGVEVVCLACHGWDPIGGAPYLKQREEESAMPYVLGFGKYKGQEITAIHRKALEYYLDWDQLRPEARQAIEAELKTRDLTGEEPEGAATPTEKAESRGPDIARAIKLLQDALAALTVQPRRTAKPGGWSAKPPPRREPEQAPLADDSQVPF